MSNEIGRKKTRIEKAVANMLQLAQRGTDPQEAAAAKILMAAVEDAGKQMRRSTQAA